MHNPLDYQRDLVENILLASLEMEMENNGYEPVYNPGYDPLELVELRLSLESAIKKLKRAHPNYAELLSDLLEGLTIPEIALKRDKAESTVQEQIERSFLDNMK